MRFLYFSPVHSSSYAQRPHFTVRAWLERGVESVLWVNPYPCRLPTWQDLRRARGLHDQQTSLDSRMRVLDVPALPVEPLPLGVWLNRRMLWRGVWREIEQFASEDSLIVGIGRPCALALSALDELRPEASFYDAMDNFPEFHRGLSRAAMRAHEDAIAAKVDGIVASSTFLADKFTRRGLRVQKVLNACEPPQPNARKGEADNRRVSESRPGTPILGYVGCLGRWFDWPLVMRLAEAAPRCVLELIGPCAVRPPKPIPRNVRLMPPCNHREIAAHLERFTVGLVPFVNNALTAGVDPIKYYEYRAAGLPVLSTSFGEMALRDHRDRVFFLDQSADLAATVEAALGNRAEIAETDRFSNDNRWASRFQASHYFDFLLPAPRKRRAA